MNRASLFTLGCRVNQAESDSLGSALIARGYRLVPEGEEAELCVINTCSVTEQADAKCRHLVRSILRRSPNAFVVVTGCYAQSDVESLRRIPGVDLIVGTEQKMDIPRLVPFGAEPLVKAPATRVLHTTRISRKNFILDTYAAFDSATRPNIKIQDGCDFFCTFCIIPFTRGRERSRDFEDVLREVRLWGERGHKEVVLSGVNVGEYRHEGRDLVDLIQAIEGIPGTERIRISSIEPTTISDRLLDHMAGSSRLCPYLHIPLQSGSDPILSAMGRRYRAREYEDLVRRAVEKIPGLGLGTDVMVGFPAESEEDFQATVDLLERLPFSYFHVFPFSKRKGTRAQKLANAVAPATLRERGRRLQELSGAKRRAFYEEHVGRRVPILLEQLEEGLWSGLTPNYIRVGVPVDSAGGELGGQIRTVLIEGIGKGMALGAF